MPYYPLRMRLPVSIKTNASLLAALIAAIAWWLLTRPYNGIWHDGLYYTAQALKRLYPQQYAQDVFFLYGSQDNFTLFGMLQARMTGQLGVDRAFLLLTVTGAALWLYALLSLLRRWLSVVPLVAALILVLGADSHYGGFDVFSYGERFASPRLFSEALVLLSLSLWMEGRKLSAYCLAVGAALLHPLTALVGIGVLAWSALNARATRLTVLLVMVSGLLGMQLLVWVGLSPQFDPFWQRLVALRSPFVFPHLWNLDDWLRLALDASLLWLASRFLRTEAGKLAGWILAVLALAMFWALAAEAMAVQLVVAAQIYRVQWLAHLLALALAVPLCLRLWQSSVTWDRYLAIGVASSLVFPLNLGGVILPIVYGLYRWAGYRMPDKPPGRSLSLLLFVGFPLTGLALWLFYFASNLMLGAQVSGRPVWLIVFIQAPVALGLFLAGHAMAKRLRRDWAWLWIYGAGVLVIGTLNWDVRKPWDGVFDQTERVAAIAPVQALIPENAVVYWESGVYVTPDNLARLDKGLERSWLWLQRSHYASFDQAAGNVFYRQTAVEIARRVSRLRQWGFRDGSLDWMERRKPPRKLPLTEARLRGVCGDPVLGFVITDTELPSASMNFQDPLTGRKFSVYDCAAMRVSQADRGMSDTPK